MITLSISEVDSLWLAAANLFSMGQTSDGLRLAQIALRCPPPSAYAEYQKERFIRLYGVDRFAELSEG